MTNEGNAQFTLLSNIRIYIWLKQAIKNDSVTRNSTDWDDYISKMYDLIKEDLKFLVNNSYLRAF